MTDLYANGVCTYGEGEAPGSGCIKPAGHDGAHYVTPGDASELDDDLLCDSAFPSDDMRVGHLCELPTGHEGECRSTVEIEGAKRTRLLTWTNFAR